MARIAVIGAGYVGLCTAVVFANHGHDVELVDVSEARVRAVQEGRAPFYEPGLQEALAKALASGRLRATMDLPSAVRASSFSFLCVPTPQGADGAADLSFVDRAARQVGEALKGRTGERHVVVTKSTVPPGTAEDVVAPAVHAGAGASTASGAIGVASNPEFLKEGSAMKDAEKPDRIVVGALDEADARRVLSLYDDFSCPKIVVDARTSETIKYASNAFLALKIAYANEIANVCERIGVDWYQVVEGMGHDARIGPLFLRAGIGFGGSCFPKDVAALESIATRAGAPSKLLRATLEHNAVQPREAVRMLEEELGDLRGKRIALLGLAFKPDTDDVRETRALPLLRELEARGAIVACHDPKAADTFRALAPHARIVRTAREAIEGADGVVIATEWREYRSVAPNEWKAWLRVPVVVDGRRTLDPHALREAGVRYRAIGLGLTRSPSSPAPPSRRGPRAP